MLIGNSAHPPWALGDRDTFLELLAQQKCPNPDEALDELLRRGLVDDEAGALSVHDGPGEQERGRNTERQRSYYRRKK